jgi:hypothetical protein
MDMIRHYDEDDLINVLTADHRHIDGLFGRYQELADGDASDRRVAAFTVAEYLRRHVEIEHRYIDSAIKAHFPHGTDTVGRLERERTELEHLLIGIETPGLPDGEFGARMLACAEWFRQHLSTTESTLFPRLYRRCDAEWLHAAGSRLLAESR